MPYQSCQKLAVIQSRPKRKALIERYHGTGSSADQVAQFLRGQWKRGQVIADFGLPFPECALHSCVGESWSGCEQLIDRLSHRSAGGFEGGRSRGDRRERGRAIHFGRGRIALGEEFGPGKELLFERARLIAEIRDETVDVGRRITEGARELIERRERGIDRLGTDTGSLRSSRLTQTQFAQAARKRGVLLGTPADNIDIFQPGGAVEPQVREILPEEAEPFPEKENGDQREDNHGDQGVPTEVGFDQLLDAPFRNDGTLPRRQQGGDIGNTFHLCQDGRERQGPEGLLCYDSVTAATRLTGASGSEKLIVVPRPTSLSASTLPPCNCAMCFTIERPKPVPPSSRLRALSAR